MRLPKSAVEAVVEALGNGRCTGAEIVVVGPQTGSKVTHCPRCLKVCCKRTSFDVGQKVDGRRNAVVTPRLPALLHPLARSPPSSTIPSVHCHIKGTIRSVRLPTVRVAIREV